MTDHITGIPMWIIFIVLTIGFGVFVLGHIIPARSMMREYPTHKRTFIKDYEARKPPGGRLNRMSAQAMALSAAEAVQDGLYRTVAVGTDGSETAAMAVHAATDLAARHAAKLVIISSYTPVDEDTLLAQHDEAPTDLHWALNPTHEVDTILETAAAGAQARGLIVSTVAAQGNPADILCQYAADQDADVLIIGNKGMERRILGSVPNSVAHKAPCSVLIVKTYDKHTADLAAPDIQTVAVGTDGTPTAAIAVEAAADLAERHGARLLIISSYATPDEDSLALQQPGALVDDQWAANPVNRVDTLVEAAASGARARGLDVSTVTAQGKPAEVLCQCAADRDVDVLVIGNKGMERRILGSVPNSVAHNAPCSVLIVKTT